MKKPENQLLKLSMNEFRLEKYQSSWQIIHAFSQDPANIYLLEVDNRDTRKSVNFKYVLHLLLVSLLLILNKWMLVWQWKQQTNAFDLLKVNNRGIRIKGCQWKWFCVYC